MSEIERGSGTPSRLMYDKLVEEHASAIRQLDAEWHRAQAAESERDEAMGLLGELSEKWCDVRVAGNAAKITALGDAVRRARELTDSHSARSAS